MGYEKIYDIIEKVDDIRVKGKSKVYYHNINRKEILYELGKIVYQVISAYWLYDKYNKKDVSVYEIEKIVSKNKTSILEDMYNEWLKFYIDSKIKLGYFTKERYINNIYILIAIMYLEYGFQYTFSQISDFIQNRYTKCFLEIPEKYKNGIIYDEKEKRRIETIADFFSLSEDYYYYKELGTATSFESANNTSSDTALSYLGIYVCELLAVEYIIEHCDNIKANELMWNKGCMLNPWRIRLNLPSTLYKFIRKDNESIVNDFRKRYLTNNTDIVVTYYNVTAFKNIVAMLFYNSICNNDDKILSICKNMLEKYSNNEFKKIDMYPDSKRKFMYYIAKINDINCTENVITGKQVGTVSNSRKTCFNLVLKFNSTVEEIVKWSTKSNKLYKDIFPLFYSRTKDSVLLHRDEIKIYAYTNPQEDVENISKEIPIKSNVDFNSEKYVLYIMKKTSNCINRNHSVRAVTGILKNLNGRKVKLNVSYCENCNRFFINHMDYDVYCKKYGIMLGNFSLQYMDFGKIDDKKYKLAKESPLHFCGYNVNKQIGLTENERHQILSHIMDYNIMKKPEIIEYLHFYINNIGNRANMDLAVSKWEDDLYFVNNYKIDTQRRYQIDKVKQR